MTNSNSQGSANEPIEDRIYHWHLQGRANRPLQVYFYLNRWSQISESGKRQWLTFAQSQIVIASTIMVVQEDTCEWVVVKKSSPQADICVASKRIHIRGLSAALSDIPELPTNI